MAKPDLFPSLSSFEDSHLDDIPDNAWLVKPCEVYKDEYSDCKSIKARFHQYFVFGETVDCTQWKKDFDSCMDWRRNRNADSLKDVVKSEERRIIERKLNAVRNDVWELRDKPPEDWNAPLPDYLIRAGEISYLVQKQKELRGVVVPHDENKEKSDFCVIS